MPYVLGIDVGTSRTRAAVCRDTAAGWSDPVPVPLGTRHPAAPTVVYLAADRSAAVGDEAEQHASADPTRIARAFPSRIGDDVPLVLGGTPCTAQELTAVLVRWVTDRAAEQEGGPATAVVVTHPANWGGHRRALLHHELSRQGLPDVTLLAEPIALAEGYVGEPLDPGDTLATYGLGAGAAEAAVVRRTGVGTFELLADAEGAEAVGGGHFDDAIVECVRGQLGRALDDLDPGDPQAWLAMARLRGMCTGAKELLSTEVEVIVPVRLPDAPADVRVTRTDFERVIRPAVAAGADLVPRTLRAAGVVATDLSAVVLAGGSVRVPLVAELVRGRIAARVVVAPEPDGAVAAGAAVAARRSLTGPERAAVPVPVVRDGLELTEVIQVSAIARYAGERALDPDDVDTEFGVEPPARPPVDVLPIELPEPPLVRRLLAGVRPATLTVSTIAVAAVGIVLTFVLESGSGHSSPTSPLHIGPTQQTANQSAPGN
ncbi:MAG TPA: Hsp70 family protein [Pseudonocardiaceae bacterium]|nr:Hsp70 family protein [Pseudonocardiaceae bacterium]